MLNAESVKQLLNTDNFILKSNLKIKISADNKSILALYLLYALCLRPWALCFRLI